MKKLFFLLCVLFFYAEGLYQTRVFDLSDEKLLSKGVFNNVSLDKNGELQLSQYVSKLVGIDSSMAWAFYATPKEWFVGVGRDASVYRIDKKTKEFKKISLGTTADLSAIVSKGDDLFLATSNPSALYKMSLKSENFEKIADLEEKYVWDMLFFKENLYLATGDPGKILKVDVENKRVETFFDKNDANIVKLKEQEGKIYAATTKVGLIYEITSPSQFKVAYTFKDFDVTDFDFSGKTLYVATVSANSSEKQKVASVIFSIQDDKMRPVYKTDETISALSVLKGDLVFSSFNEGKNSFYKYFQANDKVELLFSTSQEKSSFTNKILNDSGKSLFLTSVGDLYEHKAESNASGEYLSSLLDARNIAAWGRLDFLSDDKDAFKVYTRTGMSSFEDDSWEDWRELRKDGRIESSPSRYLRLKIVFKEKDFQNKNSKKIWGLKVYYASDESSISIKDFFVTRDESLFQKLQVQYSYESLLLFWSVQNDSASSKDLSYKIFFKKSGEKEWSELTKPLFKTFYQVNRFLFPEGSYDFKIAAFLGGKEELGSRELRGVLIDNTAPSVEYLYEQASLLGFRAFDKNGMIKKFKYSFDRSSEEWFDAVPLDKVFDSSEETFAISKSNSLKIKEIYIYVEDNSGNFSYQTFPLKP